MQFGIKGADLARGLGYCETAVELTKTSSKVLINVRLEAIGNQLHMALTDLEVTAQYVIPADVTEPGVVLVSAEKLLGIAKGSKQTNIQFTQTGENPVDVKRVGAGYELPITTAGLFPTLDERIECRFKIPVRVFNSLVDRTIFAAGYSEKFGTATDAIHFEGIPDEILAIASDTAKVATATFAWSAGDDFPELNVPKRVAKALFDLTKSIDETEDMSRMIEFEERGTKVFFSFDNFFMTTLKPNVDYPQLRPVLAKIPRDNQVALQPDDLRQALVDATLIQEKDSKGVIFKVAGDRMTLHESSFGKADAAIPCIYSGENIEIALRPKTVMDYLDSAVNGGGETALSFFIPSAPRTPVVFSFLSSVGRSELLQAPVDLKT